MPSSTTSSESPSRRLSDFDVRATTTIRSAWLPPVMKVFDHRCRVSLLRRHGPQGVPARRRASKRIMWESRNWPAESAFELQAPIAEVVRSSEDAREGARAFADKRAPAWRGQ
jgi:enoyl-CoA hydratase/carnithine racemase